MKLKVDSYDIDKHIKDNINTTSSLCEYCDGLGLIRQHILYHYTSENILEHIVNLIQDCMFKL